jgi:hypothetical protein
MKKQLSTVEAQRIIEDLESYLSDIKNKWDQQAFKKTWFGINVQNFLCVMRFLLNSVDELVLFVEPIIPDGKDKKAAVMVIIGRIFDYIVIQSFPLWLRPFSPIIRKIVIDIMISDLVEFMVNKYKSGFWSQIQESSQNGQTNQENQTN